MMELYSTLSLFLADSLSSQGGCEIRSDSRLRGPVGLRPAPPAGAGMSLHLITTLSGFDMAGNCLLKRMEGMFVA